MARLSDVCRTLAALDAQHDADWYAVRTQICRSDGLIRPSRRGNAASELDANEAVLVLLACLAPVSNSRAAEAAAQIASLRAMPMGRLGKSLDCLDAVQTCETFGAAVTALITDPDPLVGFMMALTDVKYPQLPEDARYGVLTYPTLTVEVSGLQASIQLTSPTDFGATVETLFYQTYAIDILRPDMAAFYGGGLQPIPGCERADLKMVASFGIRTVMRVNETLFPAEAPDDGR